MKSVYLKSEGIKNWWTFPSNFNWNWNFNTSEKRAISSKSYKYLAANDKVDRKKAQLEQKSSFMNTSKYQ